MLKMEDTRADTRRAKHQVAGAPGLPRVRSHALFLDVTQEEPGVLIPRKASRGGETRPRQLATEKLEGHTPGPTGCVQFHTHNAFNFACRVILQQPQSAMHSRLAADSAHLC